jgi:hypothetical protein
VNRLERDLLTAQQNTNEESFYYPEYIAELLIDLKAFTDSSLLVFGRCAYCFASQNVPIEGATFVDYEGKGWPVLAYEPTEEHMADCTWNNLRKKWMSDG